ncbi:MAG: hypothetical protein GY714_29870 [Desulfobacterales bacterium]|nr:hypothetical protein [Desulfobacterales bacterium]MCP4158733.1 hypothetical protein [Deltaproteobacteria bacterium]
MTIKKEIIQTVAEFKKFWENYGPYKFALTSNKFPEEFLEDEQWIFANESSDIFKTLFDWDKNKMKIVKSPFKKGAYPENIAPYKIANFPDELIDYNCSSFNYNGYVTKNVLEKSKSDDPKDVEEGLFKELEETISDLGYDLLKPSHGSKDAYVQEFIKEWLEDEEA